MGLRSLKPRKPSSPDAFAVVYSEAFLAVVHRLLGLAGARLSKAALRDHDEVAITGFLVKYMTDALEGGRFDSRGFMLSVHDDPPLFTGTQQGKSRPRVDVRIESVVPGPRPRFSIEAKEARKNKLSI